MAKTQAVKKSDNAVDKILGRVQARKSLKRSVNKASPTAGLLDQTRRLSKSKIPYKGILKREVRIVLTQDPLIDALARNRIRKIGGDTKSKRDGESSAREEVAAGVESVKIVPPMKKKVKGSMVRKTQAFPTRRVTRGVSGVVASKVIEKRQTKGVNKSPKSKAIEKLQTISTKSKVVAEDNGKLQKIDSKSKVANVDGELQIIDQTSNVVAKDGEKLQTKKVINGPKPKVVTAVISKEKPAGRVTRGNKR